MGSFPDVVARFRDRLRARDDRELASAVEAARLHRRDLGLGREAVASGDVGRLEPVAFFTRQRTDRGFSREEPASKFRRGPSERTDGAGAGDEPVDGHGTESVSRVECQVWPDKLPLPHTLDSQTRAKTTTELLPPNANEFEIATSTSASREALGT